MKQKRQAPILGQRHNTQSTPRMFLQLGKNSYESVAYGGHIQPPIGTGSGSYGCHGGSWRSNCGSRAL